MQEALKVLVAIEVLVIFISLTFKIECSNSGPRVFPKYDPADEKNAASKKCLCVNRILHAGVQKHL